jgi:hypothetical protein
LRSEALNQLLLVLIAIGIFCLLALDLGWIAHRKPPEATDTGRYDLMVIGIARELLLLDTATGQAWRASFRGTRWQPMMPPTRAEDATEGTSGEVEQQDAS